VTSPWFAGDATDVGVSPNRRFIIGELRLPGRCLSRTAVKDNRV